MSKREENTDFMQDSIVRKLADKIEELCKKFEQRIDQINKKHKKNSIYATVYSEMLKVHKLRLQIFTKDERFSFLDRPLEEIRGEWSLYAKNLKRQELERNFTELAISSDVHSLLLQTYTGLYESVFASFEAIQRGRISKSNSKQAGKERRFKSNKECLTACLEMLKKERKRELKDTDYARFRSIVISIPAPYQPKPRENAEDKALSSEDREKNLEQKLEERRAHNGWAPSSIYDFWIKTTKLKATTKKSSSLKC